MQVNTTKHQTLHDISPRQYNPYVNKSYYVNTELEDEYEDDMDEYTEDEDTEDEDTEEEYGRYEDTEDEDCKDKELDEEDDEVKYYWLHQVDDFIEQDPTWKGYDHNLLRLHPDNLKEFLEKQQKKGIFKPRNLSHVEWMKIDYIRSSRQTSQDIINLKTKNVKRTNTQWKSTQKINTQRKSTQKMKIKNVKNRHINRNTMIVGREVKDICNGYINNCPTTVK